MERQRAEGMGKPTSEVTAELTSAVGAVAISEVDDFHGCLAPLTGGATDSASNNASDTASDMASDGAGDGAGDGTIAKGGECLLGGSMKCHRQVGT